MCRLICNLPELNIRIYQSACFLFKLLGMNVGSQISFADRWFLYLMLSNFSLLRYVFRITDPDT